MSETQTILVQMGLRRRGDRPVPVEGEVHGYFAVVRGAGWWHLYHLGTGLSMCRLVEKRLAVECAEELSALPDIDWSFTQPEQFRDAPAGKRARNFVRVFEYRDGWVDIGHGAMMHTRYRLK